MMALRHIRLTRKAGKAITTAIKYFIHKKNLHMLRHNYYHRHKHNESKFLKMMQEKSTMVKSFAEFDSVQSLHGV